MILQSWDDGVAVESRVGSVSEIWLNRELLQRMRSASDVKQKVSEVFELLQDSVFRYLVRVLDDPSEAEDVMQEAFIRLVVPEWDAWHAPLRRFLAAKAFANWTAYQGRGVLSIVRGLEAALALARVEAARECRNAGRVLDADLLKQAFRAADFVLNHIAIGEDLANAWSRVEDGGP